jgi:hypothetical protein
LVISSNRTADGGIYCPDDSCDSGGGIGGGLYNHEGKSLHQSNSIVADNSMGNCIGTITSSDYNLNSDDSCNLTQPRDFPNTDPLLGH